MIHYISGKINIKNPTFVVIDINGIGYHINISLTTYAEIKNLETVKLFTYTHYREDAHTLFGFKEELEKTLFIHLLSVSGIGPNIARIVLSSMTAQEVRNAIIGENVPAFNKVKGIGPKTAKRVILDLKEKMIKMVGVPNLESNIIQNNKARDEALKALEALGFPRVSIQKALKNIYKNPDNKNLTVEHLIKLALRQFS